MHMNKLEQAARQALVALEDVMADFDGSWALADTAITALRSALADSAASSSEALAEPKDSWPESDEHKRQLVEGQRKWLAEKAEPSQLADASLEPVAYTFKEDVILAKHWTADHPPSGWTPLYAAPLALQDTHATHVVRTKDLCNPLQDLTDDEIISALGADMDTDENKEWFMEIARLGIAADREKNK